jgi:hypothetical protein
VEKGSGRLLPAENRRVSVIIGAAALAASMLLLAWLNTKITVYSDDYWYGTFYNGGLGQFWANMVRHYNETNGRFYVHLIVPTVLLFDTKLFIWLSPPLLALLYWFGARMLWDGLPKQGIYFSAALGILCTMACDVEYLRMTLLWISAYFNYVFPVMMLALAGYFQKRRVDGNQTGTGHVFGLIFAVLAGASTEQCGIMSLVVTWGYAILSRAAHHDPRRRCWDYPVFVLLGFMTILLSPGSWARMDRGVSGGFLSFLVPSVFMARFCDAMSYVVKYPSTVILLCALFALSALAYLADRRLTKWLLLGLPLAAGQLAFYFLGLTRWACVWAVAGLLAAAVMFLLRREYWETGLMILAAVASHMMLIITTQCSERTVFVGIIALTVTAISLLMRVLYAAAGAGRLKKSPGVPARAAVLCVLAAVCVCAYVPTLKGYTASKKIVDENLASIRRSRATGVCYFNIDIDPRYRFTMPFEGAYFYENFRAYYQIPDSTRLVFTSSEWTLKDIASDAETCVFPTLEKGGRLYFPIEFAVSAAGGRAVFSWRDHSYSITVNGKNYTALEDGTLIEALPDGTQRTIAADFTVFPPFSSTYTLLYCPADKLAQYLGVIWKYDAANGVYNVERTGA